MGESGERLERRSAVLLVALLLAFGASACGGNDQAGFEDVPRSTKPAAPPECPVRDHLAADPHGIRIPGAPTPDQYAFLEAQTDGCHPVRFNPCEPVHYVVNDVLAPPDAARDLAAAMQQLGEATGMSFTDDGPTDEIAVTAIGRSPYQPERYGERWAPILIVWGHGAPAGLNETNPGGGRPLRVGDAYVSGFLLLNVDALTSDRKPIPSGFGAGTTWGRVILHEMAHILGLGHVADEDQLMFHELGGQKGRAELAAGDRLGLRIIGREGGCLPTPPLPAARPRP